MTIYVQIQESCVLRPPIVFDHVCCGTVIFGDPHRRGDIFFRQNLCSRYFGVMILSFSGCFFMCIFEPTNRGRLCVRQ